MHSHVVGQEPEKPKANVNQMYKAASNMDLKINVPNTKVFVFDKENKSILLAGCI